MDIEKAWNKALKNTEIIRSRVQALMTGSDTDVPYILLSESSINIGDTVVRKGVVNVQKPSLIIPPNNPQFKGFDIDADDPVNDSALINFLIVRGITLPSLKYDNRTNSLDVYEGKLSKAVKYYSDILQQKENVDTGLVLGPEDCWAFSLLIFICAQVAKNADHDIRKLLDEYKRKNNENS